ncbi:hypothetical protein QAD02_001535 [Eretmocerus hayati]|uniref:Uncharacterized protein n=1 Tax=Eretmocerus hayati TaxID=131215 RepID=A0ACC2NH73_9HYME|nr:hypothetical protein QAD02_001535 [Eretmocerus hayati]
MPAHPRTKMTCLRVMRGDGVDVTPAAIQFEGRISPPPKSPVSPNKNQKQTQQHQQRERKALIELHQPSLELAAISYSSQELKMPVIPSIRSDRETQLEERVLVELEMEMRRKEIAAEEARRPEPVEARVLVCQRHGETDVSTYTTRIKLELGKFSDG